MAILAEYHRPQTLGEAVQLLRRTDVHLVPLAGGSQLVGELETRQRRDVDGVVDLAGLGLNHIEQQGDVLHVGATVTLGELSEHPVARDLAGGILRRTARTEGPINLRNQATLGGLIVSAAPDSEFYAALLALGAFVVTTDGEAESITALAALAPLSLPAPSEQAQLSGVALNVMTSKSQSGRGAGGEGPRLLTEIHIPIADLCSGHARIARTPSDRPIVAAVAVVGDGEERIALCGVADRPVLFTGQSLTPPSDFKGSADYRRAMAAVVVRRALAEARGG